MGTVKEKKLLNTINSLYPTLYNAEKKVADFVMQNYKRVINMNVAEVAEQCQVGEATIIRFCKKIGLKGFYHLKITLAKEVTNIEENSPSPTILLDDIKASIHNIFSYKIEELKQTASFLDEETVKACLKTIQQSDLVYFVAAGNSVPCALDGAYKFNHIGIRSIVYTSPEMQVSSAHSLTKNDVVIGISNSGESKLLLDIFDIAKQRLAKTICITSHMKSPLAKKADYQLNTFTNDRLFFTDFSYTRIPAVAVIDTLFLLLSHMNKGSSFKSLSDREQSLSENKF